jgi:hypothetical protein
MIERLDRMPDFDKAKRELLAAVDEFEAEVGGVTPQEDKAIRDGVLLLLAALQYRLPLEILPVVQDRHTPRLAAVVKRVLAEHGLT